ncbi:DUF262 domain-containing protein [Pedobacter jamesrossensis]|uniref:DUF262 domain-containing protein n=1 Tax=Pedobacter jamesrossensis TaxID=1908238 RepID=A0ABV8NI96_9SPHI
MEDIFKPSSLTIKQLFGNTDSLYQIPRYQRPYSWGDDQLEKLWDDLIEAKENDPNYFLGSVITAKPEDSSSYLDIVDGQQRLTTLTILLCVYRDLFPNINQNILDQDPFAVDNKVIDSSIKFNDRFERLRLRTHSNHQSDFETIILNNDTTTTKKPTKKDLRKEEPKFKFQNTSNFFTNKLNEIGEEEAGVLINYLFNSVKIIRIDCQSVAFAIKLFQVLNDRGLDLSNSDLIKSFLIGQIQKKYENDLELKKQKEDQFMDDWKVCENYSNDTETTLNDLFVMYEYYLLAQNPKKSLYDELVEELRGKDPNQVIKEIRDFIGNYRTEIYDKDDKLTYSFFYITWGMYWRSILLTALKEKYPDYLEFSKIFRRYYYLNWIAGNTLTKIKQTSFNLIKWLKEKKSLEFIKNELEQNSAETTRRAIENLQGDIYNEKWCKPLLFLIEYQQTDDSNLNFLAMWDRNIQVEHILPRAYSNNLEWRNKFELNDEIEDWVNSGANLTLLSGTKNLQASNYGFERKLGAYTGKGFYSEENEGITAFRITQKIVDDYTKNKYNKEWNLEALQDRWNWFCGQIETILEIDLTEIKH